MKTIKWIGLTLAIFFFPVIITHADSDSLKKTGRENAEAGKIASKNEIVYANLQASGSLEEIYVVNAFELDRPGIIEDYGHYSEVKNLTDTSAIAQNNNKIRINAETDMFYYQGNLSDNTQLPWSFTLEYYLNDSKIEAEELIGKSGEVEIKIAVKKTESVPSAFFENYMLQISLPLNTDKFKNIKAPDATVANSGKNKQLAFTVMPEEEKEFSI
ncbi:YhgE/Pip domain-containing protein, partial [Bacillus sp. CRN 9]|nr:YhgE/Pip domain-containing protein [Bacillus sp. CRN 9]